MIENIGVAKDDHLRLATKRPWIPNHAWDSAEVCYDGMACAHEEWPRPCKRYDDDHSRETEKWKALLFVVGKTGKCSALI